MKKILFVAALAMLAFGGMAQNTITIKGKVQFPDNRKEYNGRTYEGDFMMQVIKRNGFDKKVITEQKVNPDGTYSLQMKVTDPGVYTLSCSYWQGVEFWAENENLTVNFRGRDTAKMVIKNPPYVHIDGGPLNEVMNHVNFVGYRNYQLMIAISQNMYRAKFQDEASKNAATTEAYGMLSADYVARMNFLAHTYADRNSILAILPGVSDNEIMTKVEKSFEKRNPKYAPFIEYKKNKAERAAAVKRNETGKVAPDFSYATADGKTKLGPKDFRGKLLLIDFWASWCGPCRGEIPNMKKAYEQYKDKGVEFLSVSIDKNEKDWRKAMSEEEMTWHQVQAPDAGKQVMTDYNFSGIPYIILLDKEGRIVAKMLRGEKIQEAIEKALKGDTKVSAPAMSMGAATM